MFLRHDHQLEPSTQEMESLQFIAFNPYSLQAIQKHTMINGSECYQDI